ncbi:ThrRS/AlaRS common domain-containing protein [Polychaeton citri CBS 116435]|uniref:ThrRS/AlaRS common domain-containing protein n=1 Tax=Polychaeton citri CBS 116435 TaxID=1314669 RepID=A0A9P4Q5Q3_9PEZI|nr:ThrRS/AlaRS common domain-containing protein [Polychaeton citri CBS 116435]
MLQGSVVGALACQRDSYTCSLDAEVVSCTKLSQPSQTAVRKKGKAVSQCPPDPRPDEPSDLWLVEFSDSVLFPEGGGQPTDHGTVTLVDGVSPGRIPVSCVQRQGLRCVYHLSQPLEPGVHVRQEVDFRRRWNHMQQHTGQHLLSAVMDTYPNLATVGWGMGAGGSPNYVDLARAPSEEEMREIQDRCNALIRDNITITVAAPEEAGRDGLPPVYDGDKGVVRVIKIGDLDANRCCGTHLKQTSHISLILLHSTQTVHGGQCRLHFSAGDWAIALATSSIQSIRTIAKLTSSGTSPSDVLASVRKSKETAAALKKQEARLLQEIAVFEAERAVTALQRGENAWVHRAAQGLDFINMVASQVKQAIDEGRDASVVMVSGEEGTAGQIVVIGQKDAVEGLASKIKGSGIEVKGGGKGGRWQGKVLGWGKGELESLERLVRSCHGHGDL